MVVRQYLLGRTWPYTFVGWHVKVYPAPFRVCPRSDWIESQGGRRSHKVGQLLKFTLPVATGSGIKKTIFKGYQKSYATISNQKNMGRPRVMDCWFIHKQRGGSNSWNIEPSSCGGSGCLSARCVSDQSSGGWRYHRVAKLQEVLAKSYRDRQGKKMERSIEVKKLCFGEKKKMLKLGIQNPVFMNMGGCELRLYTDI